MQNPSEQHLALTHEQVFVTCRNCGYGQHLHSTDVTRSTVLACNGPECKESFSVKEGIKNAIMSDDDFLTWGFISDTVITGRDAITLGTIKEIKLKAPLKAAKKTFIMQIKPPRELCVAYFEPKVVLPDKLLIISSGNGKSTGNRCEINWVLYGNVKSPRQETWREYLQRSKESLVNKDYQGAIVEAEIAVEVTIASVLWELLVKHKSLNEDVVEWILSKVQAASERLKRVMELAIDKTIPDIDSAIYKNWAKSVADKRNRIVHMGEQATKEEASEAIGAAFEIIWLLLELCNQEPIKV